MTAVHPLAAVSPQAQLGRDVHVGPFSVVEAGAVVGDGCRLEGRVVVKSGTILGPKNHVFEGTILGGLPQHLRMPEQVGGVTIGAGNQIRENVTIHRALHAGEQTSIGDGNMLMVGVHIAHDCVVGNHTILANNVLLAGHIEVGDRAYLSGAVAVHQFCRIGKLAMVGGQSHIIKDVPPFVTVDGQSSRVVGLNLIGLKRSGMSQDDIAQLKQAYRHVYRSGLRWEEVLADMGTKFTAGPAHLMCQFLQGGTRGFVQERRTPRAATVKMPLPSEEDQHSVELRRKAG